MKKNILTIAFCFTILSMITLVSCNNELIFPLIDMEVTLEKGITGDIYSIVRYKDSLFLSNGRIYEKTAAPSSETNKENKQWELNKQEEDKQYLYLASDSTYLYALVANGITEDSEGDNTISSKSVLCYDGSTWSEIETITGTIENIFCNNAVDNDNRRAYIKVADSKPLLLNGLNEPVEVTTDKYSTLSSSVYNCTCFNGYDYFVAYDSVDSNDKYIYYTKYAANEDDSSASSTALYYHDGATENSVSIKNLLSVSVTEDYLLLGTTSGISRVKINDGIPASSTSSFDNNGNSIFNMYSLLTFVLDPSLEMSENDMYASATIYGSISSSGSDPANQGLYAYYSTRDEWNKDGTAATNGN